MALWQGPIRKNMPSLTCFKTTFISLRRIASGRLNKEGTCSSNKISTDALKRLIFSALKRISLIFFLGALFSLLVFLGYWQLDRAEQKRNLLTIQASFAKKPARDWQANATLPAPYEPIKLQGQYLGRNYYLDNQFYQHQLGYQVLSPFLLADKTLVLIDRGWIKKADLDFKNKKLKFKKNKVQSLSGVAYYPSTQASWLLGKEKVEKRKGFIVLEQLDLSLLNKFLHPLPYPFIIRLGEKEPEGFVCEWRAVNLSPQRHQAYAFQWFSLAIALFVLVLNFYFKKKE